MTALSTCTLYCWLLCLNWIKH